MKIIRIILVSIIFFASCVGNKTNEDINILPLHPYSASPTTYSNTSKSNSYVVKLFFLKGATIANDELKDTLVKFITQFLITDNDFKDYGSYNISFFRRSNEINENYRYFGGDNTLDSHDEDLLFEFHWKDKQFERCEYYRDGKVIKYIPKF